MMENMQNMGKGMCKCPHHKVVPVVVILVGVAFLLASWGMISWDTLNMLWPVLVIIAGVMMLGNKTGMCKCCQGGTCNCC